MIRLAGALAVLTGLGFGVPGILGARYLAETDRVWTFLGFPTYGDGPFADHGIPTSVPLLLGFVVVCGLEVALGVGLLLAWHPALWLQFALLPVELAYWWGFALPFGFVLGVARVVASALALRAAS